MKIIRLKFTSDFKGLKKDFEIIFDEKNDNIKSFEPICFVGLNGSGKSNILEALADIFYYLENVSRQSENISLGFGCSII